MSFIVDIPALRSSIVLRYRHRIIDLNPFLGVSDTFSASHHE